MANSFHIRKASHDDVPIIRSLSHAIWPVVYKTMISQEQINYMLEWMYNAETLHNQIVHEGITYLLIEKEIPYGFAAFGPSQNSRYKLHKLYVDPYLHGNGLGRQLIDEIFSQLPQHCTGVELQVNKNNPAVTFYQKLGFAIEMESVFDIGNDYVMDDYIMFKRAKIQSQ